MIEDGHAFVELDEYPEEDDSPALLSFNVPVECERPDFDVSDYESIDSCNPDDPVSNETIAVSQDGLCPNMLFSYNEILLIVPIALEMKRIIIVLLSLLSETYCLKFNVS